MVGRALYFEILETKGSSALMFDQSRDLRYFVQSLPFLEIIDIEELLNLFSQQDLIFLRLLFMKVHNTHESTLNRSLHHFCTMQEHQWILTNATISKISGMFLQWWSMRKLAF